LSGWGNLQEAVVRPSACACNQNDVGASLADAQVVLNEPSGATRYIVNGDCIFVVAENALHFGDCVGEHRAAFVRKELLQGANGVILERTEETHELTLRPRNSGGGFIWQGLCHWPNPYN